MGCLICSQDAGPGFPFLDRTDTRASVTVFLILSTPTNLIVDLPYEDEAPQMALILMQNPFRSLNVYLIISYISLSLWSWLFCQCWLWLKGNRCIESVTAHSHWVRATPRNTKTFSEFIHFKSHLERRMFGDLRILINLEKPESWEISNGEWLAMLNQKQ